MTSRFKIACALWAALLLAGCDNTETPSGWNGTDVPTTKIRYLGSVNGCSLYEVWDRAHNNSFKTTLCDGGAQYTESGGKTSRDVSVPTSTWTGSAVSECTYNSEKWLEIGSTCHANPGQRTPVK